MSTVLICGGRDYDDRQELARALSPLVDVDDILVHGGARGADRLADEWAKSKGIHVAVVPALWDTYGRAAGPIRNKAMLMLRPDCCVAFPGGNGTSDMVDRCIREGVPVHDFRVVWLVHPESDCVFRGRMQDADDLCHPITEAEAHSFVRQGYSASDTDREALGLGLGGWAL